MKPYPLFHIWCFDKRGNIIMCCGEMMADAAITAEWAVRLSPDMLCQKCVRAQESNEVTPARAMVDTA